MPDQFGNDNTDYSQYRTPPFVQQQQTQAQAPQYPLIPYGNVNLTGAAGRYNPNPVEGSQGSPASGHVAQGFLQGLMKGIQGRQLDEQRKQENVRSQALQWISSIPATEHNLPILTNLALDIMSAKPGAKHWSDQVFGTGNSTNAFIDDLWGRLRKVMPQEGQSAQQSREYVGELPTGGTISARPREVSDPYAPSTIGSPTGVVVPTELRPKQPQLNTLEFPAIVRGTVGRMGQSRMAKPPGDWRNASSQIFTDPNTGERFIQQYDNDTGQPRKISLGKVQTSQEILEAQKAQQKKDYLRSAASKGLLSNVLNLAAKSGLSPESFYQLPIESQEEFYQKAGVQIDKGVQAKQANLESQLPYTNARTRYANAKANAYETGQIGTGPNGEALGSGGLTAGQQVTDDRALRDDALKAKDQFESMKAEAIAAYRALDEMKRSTPTYAQKYDQQVMGKMQQLQREFEEKYAKASQMANTANKLHSGYLQGGMGNKDSTGRAWPYMEVKPGAVRSPGTAVGMPGRTATGTIKANQSSQQSSQQSPDQWEKSISNYQQPKTYDATTNGQKGKLSIIVPPEKNFDPYIQAIGQTIQHSGKSYRIIGYDVAMRKLYLAPAPAQ